MGMAVSTIPLLLLLLLYICIYVCMYLCMYVTIVILISTFPSHCFFCCFSQVKKQEILFMKTSCACVINYVIFVAPSLKMGSVLFCFLTQQTLYKVKREKINSNGIITENIKNVNRPLKARLFK
jgi:hypothetical protein